MTRAYEISGQDPAEVDFVEMHATGSSPALSLSFSLYYNRKLFLGTAAGDPTEANWVGEKFRHQDGSPLLAGSVKGNLG